MHIATVHSFILHFEFHCVNMKNLFIFSSDPMMLVISKILQLQAELCKCAYNILFLKSIALTVYHV